MRANPARKEAIRTNAMTYWPGKPCKYGHNSKRYTRTRICLQCSQEYRAKYYKETGK